MKTFRIHGKKGIDDLISEYPYSNPHDWPHFEPYFKDLTEQEYQADKEGYANKIEAINNTYIQSLKDSGEYGKVYYRDFHFTELKEFNDSNPVKLDNWSIAMPMGTKANTDDLPKFGLNYEKDKG